ncbi:MAG TPA: ATP-grasp domain-containing protein [Oscillatoriaceae cyanobacterium]
MFQQAPLTFLIIMAATHGLYAEPFLRELKRQGHRVHVVTRADALGYDWPRELIDGLYAVPDIFDAAELRRAVCYLGRELRIDRVVGPGEYDVELAASLREHLRLPGLGESAARFFRDKLAMRDGAHRGGVCVPAYTSLIHLPSVARFLADAPGPWVLKPRTEASSKGIQKLHEPGEVWDAIQALGDRASDHLLECYIAGDVYHVDGMVSEGRVLFAAAHRYGKPILDLHRDGGIYTTRRVRRGSETEKALLAMHADVLKALGLRDGVCHVEYIRGQDGRFYFLECGARVGAGLIDTMVEAESGLNLWAEWARLEVAQVRGSYAMPPVHDRHAGVLATVTPVEHPDPRPYLQAGVSHAAIDKPYHLGLLVTHEDPDWVAAKLEELAWCVGVDYAQRA